MVLIAEKKQLLLDQITLCPLDIRNHRSCPSPSIAVLNVAQQLYMAKPNRPRQFADE